MEPTIKAGDLVLVMLWPAGNSKVGRGDIIVFRDPEKPESLYVKRAVAIGATRSSCGKATCFSTGFLITSRMSRSLRLIPWKPSGR